MIIEEAGGGGRSLELRGRALPFRGVTFGTRMRQVSTWYPGSSVATMHVLGAEEPQTEMNGRWSDRYIRSFIFALGFDLDGVEDVVKVFQDWAFTGQELRVQWGPQVRTGVIESFEPSYDEEADVQWSITFAWHSRDDAQRDRAFVESQPRAQPTESALSALEEDVANVPPRAARSYVERVRGQIEAIRGVTSSYVATIRRSSINPSLPGPISNTIVRARAIAAEVESMLDDGAVPLVEVVVSSHVRDRLRGDLRRRNVARSAFRLRAESDAESLKARRRSAPVERKVVQIREGQTLRSLSMDAYGTSDEWSRIATANGWTSSIVPAGTMVLIPQLSDVFGDC